MISNGNSANVEKFSQGNTHDVLVVGAGPAGLLAAITLARYGIDFRIIDKRPQKVMYGHAKGLQPRTLEIFHSLGLHQGVGSLSGTCTEMSFWHRKGSELERLEYSPEADITNPTPYSAIHVLHQGHLESVLLNDLTSRGIAVDRPVQYLNYSNSDNSEYPLKVHLKHHNTGVIEEILVKYVIGGDGAASTVRSTLGIKSSIHQTADTWAVADVSAATDFPDALRRCAIRTEEGSAMLIPSGGGDAMRIYTLLNPGEVSNLSASKYEGRNVHPTNDLTVIEVLNQRIQKLLHPYRLCITSVEWVSMYRIAQRASDSFCDPSNRIFIVGDACHTHSPKAGQGMNVSMNDSYNLTWKLAMVLRGFAKSDLLTTYQTERHHIARQLIEFDEKYAHLFATPSESTEFHDLYVQSKGFTSGCGHHYPLTNLTKSTTGVTLNQKALEPLTPGKRLFPFSVTRNNSGSHINILDDLPSNGKFKLFVFAGPGPDKGALQPISDLLRSTRNRQLRSLSPEATETMTDVLRDPSKGDASVIDLYCIHTLPHLRTNLAEVFAAPFFPMWQSRIYEDVSGQAHKELGVDVSSGACAIVRPDGYVGLVTSLDGKGIEEYFDEILVAE